MKRPPAGKTLTARKGDRLGNLSDVFYHEREEIVNGKFV